MPAEPGAGTGPEVRAAGGVVYRRSGAGTGVEVVVIHRASYGDWSFPKGKLDPGETDEQAALREVTEETSLICRLGPELPATSYHDRFGRSKVVRYWAMEVLGGRLEADHEVDQAVWASPQQAAALLTYDRDQQVLAAFVELYG